MNESLLVLWSSVADSHNHCDSKEENGQCVDSHVSIGDSLHNNELVLHLPVCS